jgi:hypothetical protein
MKATVRAGILVEQEPAAMIEPTAKKKTADEYNVGSHARHAGVKPIIVRHAI